MNRAEEIKEVCLEILSKNGVDGSFKTDAAEEISAQLIQRGYVRFDSVGLDPQRCVQLMATILNGFKAEHPFCIIEKEEAKPESGVETV